MTNVSDNIRHYLKLKGMTQKVLAYKTGISEVGLRKILINGSTKHSTLETIAKVLNVSVNDLLNKDDQSFQEATPTYQKTVPVFDLQAQASNLNSFDDDLSQLPKSYVQVPGFEDCSFAVYVWNHSMYPTYENGCMVIVKEIKRKEAIQFGSVYLVLTDEQRVVKRIYESEDEEYLILASDNPESQKNGLPKFPQYKVKKEVVRKIFLVKGTIKRTEI